MPRSLQSSIVAEYKDVQWQGRRGGRGTQWKEDPAADEETHQSLAVEAPASRLGATGHP